MKRKISTLLIALGLAGAVFPASAVEVTPDNPLVLFEGTHNFSSDWEGKLAIKPEKYDNFFTETPSSAYKYYISFSSSGSVQVGYAQGYFDGDTYHETNGTHSEIATTTDDILITNDLAGKLKSDYNLQFNSNGGSISKVEIKAVAVPVESIKTTIFSFNGSNGHDSGDYTVTTTEDANLKYWNTADYGGMFKITGDYMDNCGLNDALKIGDKIVFDFSAWAQVDSNVTVYNLSGDSTNELYKEQSVSTDTKIYILDVNSDNIELLKGGIGIKGKYLNLSSVYVLSSKEWAFTPVGTATETRKFEMVDLFVPGTYPFDHTKDTFGTKDVPAAHAWLGTGKLVCGVEPDAPYGQDGVAYYELYNDWFDEAAVNSNDDKKHWSEQLGENTTYPLKLSFTDVRNFSRVRLGDEIIINVTTVPKEEGTINRNAEAQLGTYEPGKTDADDPNAGFKTITVGTDDDGNPLNFKDWGTEAGAKEIIFKVDTDLLDCITNWGLTINGRNYRVNSVKVKTFTTQAEIDGEVDPTKNVEEHFVRYYISNDELNNDYRINDDIFIEVNSGSKYNHTTTSKYNSKGVFLGVETVAHEDRDYPEGEKAELGVQINYINKDGGFVRLHVRDFLGDQHFSGSASSSKVRSRVADNNGWNQIVTPEDATIHTLKVGDCRYINITNLSETAKDAINERGLMMRGQKFTAKGNREGILSGIEDVEADNKIDMTQPHEVYNLMGVKVESPAPGNVYIVKQGFKVSKMVIIK